MRTFDQPEVCGVILPTSQRSSNGLIPVQLPRKPLRFPHKFQQEKKIGELQSGKLPVPQDHRDVAFHLGLYLGTPFVIRDNLFGREIRSSTL